MLCSLDPAQALARPAVRSPVPTSELFRDELEPSSYAYRDRRGPAICDDARLWLGSCGRAACSMIAVDDVAAFGLLEDDRAFQDTAGDISP